MLTRSWLIRSNIFRLSVRRVGPDVISKILSQHSAISKVACQTDAIGSVAKISSSTTLTYTMTVLAELHGTYHENREHTFGRFFDVLIAPF